MHGTHSPAGTRTSCELSRALQVGEETSHRVLGYPGTTGYQDRGAPASPQVLTWSWLEMYIQAHSGLLSQTLWVARVCSHLPPGCSMAATWRSHSRLPRAPGNCPRLRVIVTPLDPPSRSSPRKVHADPMCSQGAGQACPDAVRPLCGPSMQSPSHSLAQLMGLPSW